MKCLKLLCFILTIPLFIHHTQAQDGEPDNRPVLDPWSTGLLIDNHTPLTPWAKSLEFIIHHRFGKIEDFSDLFGIYAPSNIRLGLNYGVTDNLMVGFGTEKNNKLQDFQVKWTPIRQTRSGNIPVSLSVYGNFAIDARNKEVFGENYAFTNRFSYFSQLIIARKFGNRASVLLAPSFSHFNAADSLWDHDKIGISLGTRIRVYNQISFIAEYDQPLHIESIREYRDPILSKPNVAFGFEIGTPTHAFQVFAAPWSEIVPQKNFAFNQNDFTKGDFRLGFNIIARF